MHNCAVVELFVVRLFFGTCEDISLTFFEKSWVMIMRGILWSALPWPEQRFILYSALINHSK